MYGAVTTPSPIEQAFELTDELLEQMLTPSRAHPPTSVSSLGSTTPSTAPQAAKFKHSAPNAKRAKPSTTLARQVSHPPTHVPAKHKQVRCLLLFLLRFTHSHASVFFLQDSIVRALSDDAVADDDDDEADDDVKVTTATTATLKISRFASQFVRRRVSKGPNPHRSTAPSKHKKP